MKIERETDREYRRWSVEIDSWFDRSAVVGVLALLGGGAGTVAVLARLLGM